MPSLIAVLGLNSTPFKAGLNDAHLAAQRAGGEIAKSLAGDLSGRLVGVASLATIEEATRRTIEWGKRIEDLAAATGMSIREVQLLDHALQMSGSSMEQAGKFFTQFAVNRDKALRGNKEMVDHFKNLGLSVEDLRRKRFFEAFVTVGEQVRAGDPQTLISDLRAIGGKGAKEMTAAFVRGLPDMIKAIDGTIAVAGAATIASLKHVSEEAGTFKAKGRGLFAEALGGLTGVFLPAIGDMFRGPARGEGIFAMWDEAITRRKAEFLMRGQELLDRSEKLAGLGGETQEDRIAQAEKGKTDHWKKIHAHAQEQVRLAKEIAKLHDEAQKTRADSVLKQQTTAEKEAAIRNRIKLLTDEMTHKHGVERAKLDVERAKEEAKLADLESTRPSRSGQDLNMLQKIGGMFVSPLEQSMHDHARQTAHNTRKIMEHLTGKHTGWHGSHH